LKRNPQQQKKISTVIQIRAVAHSPYTSIFCLCLLDTADRAIVPIGANQQNNNCVTRHHCEIITA